MFCFFDNFYLCISNFSLFLSITYSGDLIRYQSLWEKLSIFEIIKFEDLFLAPQNLFLISASEIGSFQFLYPLLLYILSKLIAFQTYLSISSGIYVFLFSNLFLKGDFLLFEFF